MIHAYFGNGKGKTTAACGMALRAAGYKKRIGILQFLKGKNSGEIKALECSGLPVALIHFDYPEGFYSLMDEEGKRKIKLATDKAFEFTKEQVFSGNWDMFILDEILGVIEIGLIPVDEVCQLLKNIPQSLELVLTGRKLPSEIMELADYATEFVEKKHPMKRGIEARQGIEY